MNGKELLLLPGGVRGVAVGEVSCERARGVAGTSVTSGADGLLPKVVADPDASIRGTGGRETAFGGVLVCSRVPAPETDAPLGRDFGGTSGGTSWVPDTDAFLGRDFNSSAFFSSWPETDVFRGRDLKTSSSSTDPLRSSSAAAAFALSTIFLVSLRSTFFFNIHHMELAESQASVKTEWTICPVSNPMRLSVLRRFLSSSVENANGALRCDSAR